MKIIRLLNKFRKLRKNYIDTNNILIKAYIYFDYVWAFLIYGASFSDYFSYNFLKNRHWGRQEYITFRRHRYIQRVCNTNKNAILICRNKILFNNKFDNYLGRKWLSVDESSFDEFSNFIDSAEETIFIKGAEGFCGNDVWCEDVSKINKKELYKSLKEKSGYILEEQIKQNGEIAEFNPSSVNTIRITTIYDSKNDKVNIMKGNIRFGRGASSIDNLHAGGLAAHIDLDTGIIYKPAFDKINNQFIYHPTTQKQIVGFKIPYWNELKNYVINAARMLPEVRYIGWDVVAKGDGSFCLIEANDNADHDIQQINDKGIWKEYMKIINQLK